MERQQEDDSWHLVENIDYLEIYMAICIGNWEPRGGRDTEAVSMADVVYHGAVLSDHTYSLFGLLAAA